MYKRQSLTGGASDNTIDASAFTLGPVTIAGGEGHDVMTGGDGNDSISGAAGNDTLTGGAGDDALDGGAGNIAAVAQVDTVTLTVGTANDTWNVTVDGTALATAVVFNTDLATTAADLVAAINSDATIAALVTAADAGTGALPLTAVTTGTGFTATSTATDLSLIHI